MSMKDLQKGINLAEKFFTKQENAFSTKKPPLLVDTAEQILGVKFPLTYRTFVETKGHGGPGNVFIPGIFENDLNKIKDSGVVWGVLEDRNGLGYPMHLIKLYDVGEGTTYCLDTSQMNEEGECPVVAWPLGGYEETPVLEVVAEDFGKFFLDMVHRQIEYKKGSLIPS